MAVTNYSDAAREAVREAMRADDAVWCIGEDLGRGGVFGQYRGLQDEFGPARIADAPISEAAIMGAAFGAAMVGTRPIVEMRFSDFALCAVDELVNQAAKARYMFGGQTRVPLVVREPIGMWRSSAAQHSQSLEAWYAHIPGLVVTVPATPADNYALLKAAIRSDDPVVHMEHKNLWALSGPAADSDAPAEFGRGIVRQAGADITLVTWSATVWTALDAAAALGVEGINVEVIDLRTLWPWDRELVLESVSRTRRALVVHEAVQAGGFGAEIAATIAEELHHRLEGPVRRLGAPRAPVPYAPPMESELKITAGDVCKAVKVALGR